MNPLEIDSYCAQVLRNVESFSDESSHHIRYSIGNLGIDFKFGQAAHFDLFNASLGHLVKIQEGPPDWTIHLLDSQPLGLSLSAMPIVGKLHRGVMQYESTGRYCFQYLEQLNAVIILDQECRQGIWWSPTITEWPEHERIFPVRHLARAIFHPNGGLVLHGAVVGREGKGAFLVGKSGVGKSTTSLACLISGMQFVGDDHCLYYESMAYSVSQFVKLNDKSLELLPELGDRALYNGETTDGKAVLSLYPKFKSQLVNALRVTTILLPTLTEENRPSLTPCSPADSLMAIAPSSFSQVFVNHSDEMSRIAELVRQVPSYRLNITPDVRSVVSLIDQIVRV